MSVMEVQSVDNGIVDKRNSLVILGRQQVRRMCVVGLGSGSNMVGFERMNCLLFLSQSTPVQRSPGGNPYQDQQLKAFG